MGVAHELFSPEKQPALAYQPVRGGKTLTRFCLVFHESNELYSRNHHWYLMERMEVILIAGHFQLKNFHLNLQPK